MVFELAAEQMFNALRAVFPGVFVEKGPANILSGDLVELAMQFVAIDFVLVVAQRGGHFHEFEDPVIVGGERCSTARFMCGEVLAKIVFVPEGFDIQFFCALQEF